MQYFTSAINGVDQPVDRNRFTICLRLCMTPSGVQLLSIAHYSVINYVTQLCKAKRQKLPTWTVNFLLTLHSTIADLGREFNV